MRSASASSSSSSEPKRSTSSSSSSSSAAPAAAAEPAGKEPNSALYEAMFFHQRRAFTNSVDGDDLMALKSATSTCVGTQPPAYELSKRKAFSFSRPAAVDTSPKDIISVRQSKSD